MTAPNDKGVGSTSADAPETYENQHSDYHREGGVGKAFEALRTQLEMYGCGLHEMADRGFFVSHRGVSRQLPDLRAVRQMLVKIGGAR